MLDQRFGVSKADRTGDHIQPVHQFTTFFDPAFKLKCNHPAKTVHLLFGQRVLRIAFKAGIKDLFDLGMVRQKIGNFLGIVAMTFHAQLQRFKPAHDKVGVLCG